MVRKQYTYGTKRSATAACSTAIFGRSSPLGDSLAEITSAIGNLHVVEECGGEKIERNVKVEVDGTLGEAVGEEEEEEEEEQEEEDTQDDGDDNDEKAPEFEEDELDYLCRVYQAEAGHPLGAGNWDDLSRDSTITKIAEASYAEVYRVSHNDASSIIKILRLRHHSDGESIDVDTAIPVKDIISEVRIMNALASVPGFVAFKEALLVHGVPSAQIIRAYEDNEITLPHGSQFPHPRNSSDNSLFLVIELGDAGQVLEEFVINNMNRLWDVLLGVVVALCRAEISNEFEHRDLHENNICVTQRKTYNNFAQGQNVRFGSSGIDITLIDYGLSRARLDNGDIVFSDLELDLALFHGTGKGIAKIQFDIYRRMRNHLFSGTRGIKPRSWHTEESRDKNNGHTWREYTPWSNVLWIHYLFSYLIKAFDIASPDKQALANFISETKDFARRLSVRTSVKNGAFETATDVLNYVVSQGWISEEQLSESDFDSTSLLT